MTCWSRSTRDDLFDLAIGILGLGERPRVRLFVSPDRLDRFVACTLCLPRDRFNTDNRVRAGKILARAFGGTQVDWRLHLSESVIVRVDYVVRCPDGIRQREPVSVIEARITEVTRSWEDELRVALIVEARRAATGSSSTGASAMRSPPATEPIARRRWRSPTSPGSTSCAAPASP